MLENPNEVNGSFSSIKRYLSVQYGCGDESNSIEIVGNRGATAGYLEQLHRSSPRTQQGAMAQSVNVSGLLQLSGAVRGLHDHTDVNALPAAVLDSWGGKRDGHCFGVNDRFWSKTSAGI